MVLAQTIQFDRWCLECGITCRGRCHVVILRPESEFHQERVWKTVQGFAARKGHDSRLASLIARRLARHLKSSGVGVMVETRHRQGNGTTHPSPPLPVLTMSFAGRVKIHTALRRECFRYIRRSKPPDVLIA